MKNLLLPTKMKKKISGNRSVRVAMCWVWEEFTLYTVWERETLNGGRHVLDKGNYLREGKGSAGPKVPDRKEAMGEGIWTWDSENRRVLLQLKTMRVLVWTYLSSLSIAKHLRYRLIKRLYVALTAPIFLLAKHCAEAAPSFLSCSRPLLPDRTSVRTFILFLFSLLLLFWKIFLKISSKMRSRSRWQGGFPAERGCHLLLPV